MKATNRQKKLLRFLGVPFDANISTGAAGWEIAGLLESEKNRDLWRRYLYLTKDFDSDTEQLMPYDEAAILAVEIPEDWSSSEAVSQFRSELAASEMADGSPFDLPQPPVEFVSRQFMFTGKFAFGSRTKCQQAVIDRGGIAPTHKVVSRETDYLVVGNEGSNAWKRGAYGNKIEAAILAWREHGRPAIISEDHWLEYLGKR